MLKLNNKNVIKGMTINELEDWCESCGEKKYRGKQLFNWLYNNKRVDGVFLSNIPSSLKNLINSDTIETLEISKITSSKIENTTKILYKTYDSHYIESVSMIVDKRHTVCVSSQIGCNVGCTFCATGLMGLTRNLYCGEILDQVINTINITKTPITNVVFMGMGEPFLNYKNVLKSCEILHHPNGFNLGFNRITISTAGIISKIKKYIENNYQYKLAISLNAISDQMRKKIMPLNKKNDLNTLLSLGRKYSNRKRKNIMYEYVLLENFNDSEEDAIKLSKLIRGIYCKVNIIPYNENDLIDFKQPAIKKIERFVKILYDNQDCYTILVRWSRGRDIKAACGQLAIDN